MHHLRLVRVHKLCTLNFDLVYSEWDELGQHLHEIECPRGRLVLLVLKDEREFGAVHLDLEHEDRAVEELLAAQGHLNALNVKDWILFAGAPPFLERQVGNLITDGNDRDGSVIERSSVVR